MSFTQKLVVKGGTSISLHERFSHLNRRGAEEDEDLNAASGGANARRASTAPPPRRHQSLAPPAASAPRQRPLFAAVGRGGGGDSYEDEDEDDGDLYYAPTAFSRARRQPHSQPPAPRPLYVPPSGGYGGGGYDDQLDTSYYSPPSRIPEGHWRGGGGGGPLRRSRPSAAVSAARQHLFSTAMKVKKRALLHRLGSRPAPLMDHPTAHVPYLEPAVGGGGGYWGWGRGRGGRGGRGKDMTLSCNSDMYFNLSSCYRPRQPVPHRQPEVGRQLGVSGQRRNRSLEGKGRGKEVEAAERRGRRRRGVLRAGQPGAGILEGRRRGRFQERQRSETD